MYLHSDIFSVGGRITTFRILLCTMYVFICRDFPPLRPGMPGWIREQTTATYAISLTVIILLLEKLASGCLTRSRGLKLFSCSTQLRLKFILNVKMPIVGILTFMSRINYKLSFEPKFSTNFDYFNIYEQLKFHAQLS